MIEPNAVASVGTGLHSAPVTELCVCGLRASVRVWASECPSAPRRRVDESRQLCPRCAAIARGQPLPVSVRVEDLPPVAWTPPPPRRLSLDITCPDCGKPRPEGTKKRLCAKCERKRWRSA